MFETMTSASMTCTEAKSRWPRQERNFTRRCKCKKRRCEAVGTSIVFERRKSARRSRSWP